jgi:hypothetical protein
MQQLYMQNYVSSIACGFSSAVNKKLSLDLRRLEYAALRSKTMLSIMGLYH